MGGANYRKLKTEAEILEIANRHVDAWKHPELPKRQYDINIRELLLLDLDQWHTVPPYRAFADALKSLAYGKDEKEISLLEVGSSSGYYGKLLKKLSYEWQYTGCDYSPHFKEIAAKHFPGINIEVGDAKALPYKSEQFDIVVSGCCMIHMYDWKQAMAETRRVARNYAVFHRTPLLETSPTIYWEKLAYDVPCLEIWFNRESFYRELEKNGFDMIAEVPVFRTADEGGFGHYTIVCKKN